MIPCTIFYVETTAAMMIHASKKRLLRLIKQRQENIRGRNSLFIIITSKDDMQLFRNAENEHSKRQVSGSGGHFSPLYVIIEVTPTPPWTCTIHPTHPPIYTLFLLPPLFDPPPPLHRDWVHGDDDNHHCPPTPPPPPPLIRFCRQVGQ